ncbi:MAG TPA: polysaccharide deacetylase family protein [Ideonella sp.]|nr:polysaccharide deacetylase family protein [Ideonella sp.]
MTPLRPMATARWSGPPAVSVVIHDVAPATQAACERLIERLHGVAPAPVTLLVVPLYHGQPSTAEFEAWLEARRRAGDELALHGFTHLDEGRPPRGWAERLLRRHYTSGEGEFAAFDEAEARARLLAGLHWFHLRGWAPRGFVAPAWLLSRGTWRALDDSPLDYTCTLTRLVRLPGLVRKHPPAALRTWSQVFSARSGWRRGASLGWNRLLARAQCSAPLTRIELHPADAAHEPLCLMAEALYARAVAARRQPLTLAQAAMRLH